MALVINRAKKEGTTNVERNQETFPLLNDVEQSNIKVYKKRWYMLSLFFLLSVGQGIIYNTWSPIQSTARAVYKWDDFMIDLMPALGCVGPCLTIVPLGWLMDVKGLRTAVLLAAGFQFFGSALRCIPTGGDWLISTILICFGQALGCLTAPIPLSGPVLLSATWFPSNERTTATSILMAGSFAGFALSFIIGPLFVDDVGSISYSQLNSTEREFYYRQIRTMFLVESIAMGLLFLAVIIYYPARPPQPPSRSSGVERMDTKSGIIKLLKNHSFVLLAILYGASCGVYSGWVSVLDQLLEGFGVGQKFAGWLGFIAVVSGASSGIFFSIFADRFSGHLKQFLLIFMACATFSILIVCFIFSKVIAFNKALICVMFGLTGFFVNGALPFFFELGAEMAYPVAEGLTSSVIKFTDYSLQAIFLIVSMGHFGGTWMTWVILVTISATTILLTCVRERYNRLNIDNFPTRPTED
ncbi:solute carrier family 49 member 4 homolog [Dendronephthya gigantea]|uniref:solute carrier family 49 member 4 homolog n=1 Tax=Dendronephthya gigantea TaxID=151771 RepID=UPI00106D8F20|nr:solute carrier family 49 member 4 homolog [Dendronephthya gigantea]